LCGLSGVDGRRRVQLQYLAGVRPLLEGALGAIVQLSAIAGYDLVDLGLPLEDGRQGLGRMGLFSPTRIEVREMRKSEGERYRGLDEVRGVAS
jgi:hypothetical protein